MSDLPPVALSDIYDAIEYCSVSLYSRLKHMARDRGWAIKAYGWDHPRGPARFVRVCGIILHLPGGHAASFTPRGDALDGVWTIDIKRVDGVMHPSWGDGLRVRKVAASFDLHYRGEVLTDIDLALILEDLATVPPRRE